MIQPVELSVIRKMPPEDFRIYVSTELEDIKKEQKRVKRWLQAEVAVLSFLGATVGTVVIPRLVTFLISGITVTP